MADIFVSYASEDLERVKPLVTALENHGWSVWWDRELVAGPRFDQEIENAIREASCIVVAWSQYSIKSGWVRDEASEGMERNILLPICIDDVRPPMGFRSAQTANLLNWPKEQGEIDMMYSGIERLIRPSGKVESPTPENSIAVLPFANMSSDPEQEYFSDGISEDILNGLVKFQNLKVIARTSSFEFKGENRDIRVIGEKLDVSHILEGSVRKAGNRIRVTAQLNTVRDGTHVWSEQYNRELTDVFEVQDDITAEILKALDIQFTATDDEPRKEVNADAYNAFLLGRYYFYRGEFGLAAESYEQAISLDAEYADAYAALAYYYYLISNFGNFEENQRKSDEFSGQLKEHDPGHPFLLSQQAKAHFYADRNYQQGIDELHELAKKHPSNCDILEEYANIHHPLARSDLAIACHRRRVELDPLNPNYIFQLGYALKVAGEFDEARKLIEQAESLGFTNAAMHLADLATASGDLQLLQDQLDRGREEWGGGGKFYPFFEAAVLARTEGLTAVQDFVSQSEDLSSMPLFANSHLEMIQGETERAISTYAKALAAPEFLAFVSIHRTYRLIPNMSDHPKFQQMLCDFGLDEESLSKLNIPSLPF